MTIERINPEGLLGPPTYTPVVRASGQSTLYISGQVSVDSEGHIVGRGDFAAQVRQTFANLRTALTAAGADFSHVVKLNIYIVGYSQDMLAAFRDARAEAMGDSVPASTLIGVEALAVPGFMLEIEAIAVL